MNTGWELNLNGVPSGEVWAWSPTTKASIPGNTGKSVRVISSMSSTSNICAARYCGDIRLQDTLFPKKSLLLVNFLAQTPWKAVNPSAFLPHPSVPYGYALSICSFPSLYSSWGKIRYDHTGCSGYSGRINSVILWLHILQLKAEGLLLASLVSPVIPN